MNFNYIDPAPEANLQNVQHFKWLLGSWKTQGSSGGTIEEWRQKDDFTLEGRGYFVVNGDTIVTEEMRIEQRGPNTYFIIAKDQNHKSTKFRLRARLPNELIFENTGSKEAREMVIRNRASTNELERVLQAPPSKPIDHNGRLETPPPTERAHPETQPDTLGAYSRSFFIFPALDPRVLARIPMPSSSFTSFLAAQVHIVHTLILDHHEKKNFLPTTCACAHRVACNGHSALHLPPASSGAMLVVHIDTPILLQAAPVANWQENYNLIDYGNHFRRPINDYSANVITYEPNLHLENNVILEENTGNQNHCAVSTTPLHRMPAKIRSMRCTGIHQFVGMKAGASTSQTIFHSLGSKCSSNGTTFGT